MPPPREPGSALPGPGANPGEGVSSGGPSASVPAAVFPVPPSLAFPRAFDAEPRPPPGLASPEFEGQTKSSGEPSPPPRFDRPPRVAFPPTSISAVPVPPIPPAGELEPVGVPPVAAIPPGQVGPSPIGARLAVAGDLRRPGARRGWIAGRRTISAPRAIPGRPLRRTAAIILPLRLGGRGPSGAGRSVLAGKLGGFQRRRAVPGRQVVEVRELDGQFLLDQLVSEGDTQRLQPPASLIIGADAVRSDEEDEVRDRRVRRRASPTAGCAAFPSRSPG